MKPNPFVPIYFIINRFGGKVWKMSYKATENITTAKRGNATEFLFFSKALENGYNISQPLSYDCPYDCILETKQNRKLLKLQIKRGYETQSKSDSSFQFNTRSSNPTGNGFANHSYTKEEIDGFIVWSDKKPDLFFYVPIEKASKTSMAIYVGEYPSKQQNSYKDYLFDFTL